MSVGLDREITTFRVMYRYAGQWEPPPALYKSLAKWAAQTYAEHVLGLVEQSIERAQAPQVARNTYERLVAERAGVPAAVADLKPGRRVRYAGPDGHDLVVERTMETGPTYALYSARGTRFDSLLTWGKPLGVPEVIERIETWLDGAIKQAQKRIDAQTWAKSTPPKRLVALNLLRSECLKYGAVKPNKRSQRVEGRVDIDVTGWKYLTATEVETAPQLLEDASFDRVSCVMYFRAQHDEWNGNWDRLARRVSLDAPSGDSTTTPSIETFRKNMRSLLGTVWHEVQHVGQDLLKVIRTLPEAAGLPSRSLRDETRTPGGQPSDPKLIKKRVDNRAPHHMRDIEFYTNLDNDVRDFIDNLRSVPASLRSTYFKFYVGLPVAHADFDPDSLRYPHSGRMWKLRDQAPAKWEKLVKELRKAVEPHI